MEFRPYLLAIGVMTGNSLDGADVVLTRFDEDGTIKDLAHHNLDSPAELTESLRSLRTTINENKGQMDLVVKSLANTKADFYSVQKHYIEFVAQAIKELIQKVKSDSALSKEYNFEQIDLIGLHGQTCAHYPPSIAKTHDLNVVYTVQVGSGQMLADMTGISVVYDFRSDDVMNGGEGAPLAPIHHQHLANHIKKQGYFPLAFCNAGNTGNISYIGQDKQTGALLVMGWDAGPFNNYPDKLMQSEKNLPYDPEGKFGRLGKVNLDLLALLFDKGVTTKDGDNFLLRQPPKSSDPEWYKILPELKAEARIAGKQLAFEDRLRTVEYFSAYIYFHSLSFLPGNVLLPRSFALCGGGWKNPVMKEHFIDLLKGDSENSPVLAIHQELFKQIRSRINETLSASEKNKQDILVQFSDEFGYNGQAMEARIFADAAVCRLRGEAFTNPSTTGVKNDTVCGIIRFPQANEQNATAQVRAWLDKYKSRNLTVDDQSLNGFYNRASAGWHK